VSAPAEGVHQGPSTRRRAECPFHLVAASAAWLGLYRPEFERSGMALVLRDLFTAYEQTFIDITQTDELPFYRFLDGFAASRDADLVAVDRRRDLTTPCTISFPPPRFS
jgi:ribosome modulation factor